MAAITIGTTGTLFGVPQPESGVLITTVDRASQRQKKELPDNGGDIVAVGYYAPKAVYSLAGALMWPATGLGASYPSLLVALANVLNDGSTSGGHVYCEEFTMRFSAEDFARFTGTFTQFPGHLNKRRSAS